MLLGCGGLSNQFEVTAIHPEIGVLDEVRKSHVLRDGFPLLRITCLDVRSTPLCQIGPYCLDVVSQCSIRWLVPSLNSVIQGMIPNVFHVLVYCEVDMFL